MYDIPSFQSYQAQGPLRALRSPGATEMTLLQEKAALNPAGREPFFYSKPSVRGEHEHLETQSGLHLQFRGQGSSTRILQPPPTALRPDFGVTRLL